MDAGGAEMGQGRGQLSHEERRAIAGLQGEGMAVYGCGNDGRGGWV